jgi:hypothetical protein
MVIFYFLLCERKNENFPEKLFTSIVKGLYQLLKAEKVLMLHVV